MEKEVYIDTDICAEKFFPPVSLKMCSEMFFSFGIYYLGELTRFGLWSTVWIIPFADLF